MVGWILRLLRGKPKRRRRKRSMTSSVMRWLTPGFTMTGIAGTLVALVTGQINLPTLDSLRGSQPPVYEDPLAVPQQGDSGSLPRSSRDPIARVGLSTRQPTQVHGKSETAIRVASFNIQTFGTSKAGKSSVMDALARIFLEFDVVAVQEIKGDPAVPINALFSRIHAMGGRYNAVVSEPLGRTSQTERYGFIWDTSRMRFVVGSDYLIDDEPGDRMHREPYVATFETRVNPVDSRRPFSFTLINVHTDPDEVFGDSADNELNVLDDVYVRVRQWEYNQTGQEDFLMLGDLNVPVGDLAELGRIPNVVSLIGDQPTTTKSGKTYDHILLDRVVTQEMTGRFGVLDIQPYIGDPAIAPAQVSDHLPVWAEFGVYEAPRETYGNRTIPASYRGPTMVK